MRQSKTVFVVTPVLLAVLSLSAAAQSVLTWDFDNVSTGTHSVPESSGPPHISGILSSTNLASGTDAGSPGSPPNFYTTSFLNPTTVFVYARITTTLDATLDEVRLLGAENDPLAQLDFDIEVSAEGDPEPTQMSPGVGYATFGSYSVTSGAWQSVSVPGSHFLPAGTYNLRVRVTTPPIVGTSQQLLDDFELEFTTVPISAPADNFWGSACLVVLMATSAAWRLRAAG